MELTTEMKTNEKQTDLYLVKIMDGNLMELTTEIETANNRHGSVLPSIVDAIGQTPLIELTRLARHYGLEGRPEEPGGGGKIFAKCEYLNPGSSKKDRIARRIVQSAKSSGELRPGQTVVELTSGNTGTGLAIVCSVLGHPFVAVMSKGNSIERVKMMEALGARVELVDQADGSVQGQVSGKDLELVARRTDEIVKELGAFRADQFERRCNHDAHYYGTGPEIWQAVHNTSKGSTNANKLTAFCDFVGTGGTFSGCAAYLRPKGVRCYVVEPRGAALLAGQTVTQPNHVIQGGGYVKNLNELPMLCTTSSNNIDGYIQVSEEEAIQTTRDLAKFEGIFAGFSAGANVAAAVRLLKGTERGGAVAVLICDSGLKYLSTSLWEKS